MKTNPEILDPRQQKFADLYLSGIAAGRAYEQAGYTARGNGADSQACRALKIPKIRDYIGKERQRMIEAGQMERAELVTYLVDLIRTPVGKIDEKSPLCQEYSVEETGEDITRKRVKMPCKLGAADRLCKLMRWNEPERLEVSFNQKIADIIQRVRGDDR